jgi:DNA-binding MarR family transcriptional regulator
MESKSPPSPHDCAAGILDIIPAVMRTIRTRMRQEAAFELTVVQFRALARAVRTGGISVSEIAEHVGLTLPSASKLVDGLVKRGYLRRRIHPSDRRISMIEPTAKGKRALQTARGAARKHLATLLEHLPNRDRSVIVTAMEALRPIFTNDNGKAS